MSVFRARRCGRFDDHGHGRGSSHGDPIHRPTVLQRTTDAGAQSIHTPSGRHAMEIVRRFVAWRARSLRGGQCHISQLSLLVCGAPGRRSDVRARRRAWNSAKVLVIEKYQEDARWSRGRAYNTSAVSWRAMHCTSRRRRTSYEPTPRQITAPIPPRMSLRS
eukprot:3624887-Prymnesium_polylepis.1